MLKIVPFKKEIIFKTNIAEITSISLEHTLKVNDYVIEGDFVVSGEYKMADISTNTEKFDYKLPFSIMIDEKYIIENVLVDIDDFYYEIVNNRSLLVNIDVSVNNLEEKPLFIKNQYEIPIEGINDIDNREDEIEKSDDKVEDRADITSENIEDILDEEINNLENEEIEFNVDDKIEEIIEDKVEEKIDKIIEERLDEELAYPFKTEETEIDLVGSKKDLFSSFTEVEGVATYRIYIMREGDVIDSVIEKYGVGREILEKYNDLNDVKIGDKLIIPNE